MLQTFIGSFSTFPLFFHLLDWFKVKYVCVLLSQEFSGSYLWNRRQTESKELSIVLLPGSAARNINTGVFFKRKLTGLNSWLNGKLRCHSKCWRCTPELWPHLYKQYVAKTKQCFTSKKLQISTLSDFTIYQ